MQASSQDTLFRKTDSDKVWHIMGDMISHDDPHDHNKRRRIQNMLSQRRRREKLKISARKNEAVFTLFLDLY